MRQYALPITIAVMGLLATGGTAWYYSADKDALSEQISAAQTKIGNLTTSYEKMLSDLRTEIAALQQENQLLSEALRNEQDKNEEFADEINDIAKTVGTLEKLSKTDPELLQKYSKVYFLNEHYVPPRLSQIDSDFLYNPERKMQIHASVRSNLEDLLEDAQEDGMELKIISAFRSFGTQASLKSSYTVTYGAGSANQFSADQGYSEHQLGTAVDFTTPTVGASFVGFENTEEYDWLQDNAHKYGFILSYPANNAYYQFEPWHWRFVGEDLAKDLNRRNTNFYDMPQREIDEYLVKIFD